MKVEFVNVGRNRTTWTAEIPKLTEDALVKAIRNKHCLLSRCIDVNLEDNSIWVGGLRKVGTFRVVEREHE